jgi:inhibitor of cysteine peptidase
MVQKEIKQKTRIYGTVAALSAMILVGLVFVLGSAPGLVTNPPANPQLTALNHFTSYNELRDYIAANMQGSNTAYRGGPLDQSFFAAESGPVPAPTAAPSSIGGDSFSTKVYSTTNIQVTGVDEADIVKTDGEYIYVASNDYMSNQNHVFILKAEAGDPRVIAKITLENNTYLAGMFLSQDSSKLVIIGSQYQMFAYDVVRSDLAMIYPYYSDVKTFITVYDVSEKVHPVLARNLTLSGSYFNSRMIGNYVYAVVSQSAYVLENAVTLPKVYTDEGVSDVPADTIYYADTMPGSFMFTSFVGFNVLDSSEKLANMTILMGGASTMYVSLDNIYVTYQNYGEKGDYTSIHRIHFDKNVLTPAAEGNVPGYVLNQYSMDENGEYFRLATTSQSDTTHNNVYVLNMNMTTVGKVEGLAKDERIYSARFMGDKAYIVTFKQVDPFFIIDLSDPFNPKVAGQLKIPGYSSYLHPFDENHVIGLGMENSTVKLSLFDVTNVNAPTEIAKYTVEGDYTYSDALNEPKAFLFDKAKELLVIPISITQYGVVDSTNKEVFVNGGFWQGAYVFKVNTSGFTLRGGISHGENTTNPYYYGYNYNEQVTRALYIDNILYTISNNEVKLNSLSDLGQIAEVILR